MTMMSGITRGCIGKGLDCVPPDQWPLWQRLGFDWQVLGPKEQLLAVTPVAAMVLLIGWAALRRPDDMTPHVWAHMLATLAVGVIHGLVIVAWNTDAWLDHRTAMTWLTGLTVVLTLSEIGYLIRLCTRREASDA